MKNSLFTFTTCLPHLFLPVHWDQTMVIVCQSLGSRPTQVQELFTLAPPLWDNLLLSVHSAISDATFKKHLKTHLFDLAFPSKIRACPMACWCYGILFQFCCWTLNRLPHHWAWLHWGYWRYRNLIDCWLIINFVYFVYLTGPQQGCAALGAPWPFFKASFPRLQFRKCLDIYSSIIKFSRLWWIFRPVLIVCLFFSRLALDTTMALCTFAKPRTNLYEEDTFKR